MSKSREFSLFVLAVLVSALLFAMDDEAALIKAMQKDPGNDTIRLAYADFLDERGGPDDAARAEFIRLEIQLARETKDATARQARRDALLKEHEKTWLPPALLRNSIDVYWDRGFIHKITLKEEATQLEAPIREAIDAQPLLHDLGIAVFWRDRNPALSETIVKNLNKLQSLSRLRGLAINELHLEDEMVQAIEWNRMANLKRLMLYENHVTVVGLSHILDSRVGPQLMDLDLTSNPLSNAGSALLTTTARLPQLERLVLGGTEMTVFAPTEQCLPQLKTLDLGRLMITGSFSELLTSPLMSRLYVLFLEGQPLSSDQEWDLLEFLRTGRHALSMISVAFPHYRNQDDLPRAIQEILRKNMATRTDFCSSLVQRIAEAPSE